MTLRSQFRMLCQTELNFTKLLIWLGWLDSNQRSEIQSLLPYRLATPHRFSKFGQSGEIRTHDTSRPKGVG